MREDLTGRRFGSLTVLGYSHFKNVSYWNCICDCGTIKSYQKGNLISNNAKSCGCLKSENISKGKTKHGMKHTKEYRIWWGIKQRCFYHKNDSYKHYGGRGISMCDEWKNSFEAFYRDMGKPPHGTSIDRINNDGNYEPNNCRWATNAEQQSNRRCTVKLTIGNQTRDLEEWSKISGVGYTTIRYRLKKLQWSNQDAVFIPPYGHNVFHPDLDDRSTG